MNVMRVNRDCLLARSIISRQIKLELADAGQCVNIRFR
jgi:hypothetical protein